MTYIVMNDPEVFRLSSLHPRSLPRKQVCSNSLSNLCSSNVSYGVQPCIQDEYEYVHDRQGFAFHHGSDKLHEKAVCSSGKQEADLTYAANALFTSRYPEALADKSFDNTGCEIHTDTNESAHRLNVRQCCWKLHSTQFDGR